MRNIREQLRVALVVGELGLGGAEKQAYYLAKALQSNQVNVQVYCLNRGGYYEQAFQQLGLTPLWIGSSTHPLARLVVLIRSVGSFRPHIIQSTHFYANIYTALAAKFCRAISIGTARSDVTREVRSNGLWGRWLLSLPSILLVNSTLAKQNAIKAGLPDSRVFFLPNVVDLASFDQEFEHLPALAGEQGGLVALVVARLISVKRLDLFIKALYLARKNEPGLRGMIVGDGPERESLQHLAAKLDLSSPALTFLGQQDSIPQMLSQAAFLVLTSDREGFPNVLLEAMAARLPVITTPAGEAGIIVQDQSNGYVVPFNDPAALANQMTKLCKSQDLRKSLGENGRESVEKRYSFEALAGRLVCLYQEIASLQNTSIPLP